MPAAIAWELHLALPQQHGFLKGLHCRWQSHRTCEPSGSFTLAGWGPWPTTFKILDLLLKATELTEIHRETYCKTIRGGHHTPNNLEQIRGVPWHLIQIIDPESAAALTSPLCPKQKGQQPNLPPEVIDQANFEFVPLCGGDVRFLILVIKGSSALEHLRLCTP